jgi:ribose/xylose/arabinose/galactoside ABC-type transport system permease subunit
MSEQKALNLGDQGLAAGRMLAQVSHAPEFHRLGVLAVVLLVASLAHPSFLAFSNLQSVALSIAVVGVAAFGMTFVLLLGEIDLSVASTAALAGVAGGMLIPTGDSALVIGATLATGALVGLVNGATVSILKITSLIVTLATLSIARALCNIVSGGQSLYPEGLEGYMWLGRGSLLGVPTPIAILLLVALVAIVVTRFTVFGKKLYVAGANPKAAHASGLNVSGLRIAAFVISGACAALAGMLESARLAYVNPAGFANLELSAIAIAVLGGASLFGGKGSIEGTLIAAGIIGVVNNVLNLFGVSIYLQQVVTAGVIVLVVLPDGLRRVRSWR